MSAGHLTPATIAAFADHELAAQEIAAAQEHLAACHACALAVLSATQLKAATARAAQRYTLSPEMRARLVATTRGRTSSARTVPMRMYTWAALAALILLAVSVLQWRGLRSTASPTVAELFDQHLAVLPETSTPQVLSSDRHTVKPWFQGKLPYSFNLPEPADLPAETVLQGADLTYIGGKPAAQLLFLVRKHHVSVFVTQRDAIVLPPSQDRNGFHLVSVQAGALTLTAVSDTAEAELRAVLTVLGHAQS
ncbi:anti-sigma factor [Terriglobus albidus]|uniref:Anti-sigma factor n=1 Tax=Terriglobus albidus TaxID=1592106 RepID=A0A5B9E768_9BACT|nr:zf-HC2 domain-containing protein [Terriglobus albidus]QEE26975.1 anti-sigma factor [Terriglobus albidus]